MQFHTNGFHAGSPDIAKAAEGFESKQGELPEELDVLIVGSGPAGLTLGAQLSQYPQIKTRVIELKAEPMTLGQADGISCRSMEMFEAFGFCEQVLKEGYWVNETNFWKPDPHNPNGIIRNARVQDVKDGLSEMPHIVLNQGRVHDLYMDVMRNSPTRLEVDYQHKLIDLQINQAGDYPIIATIDCNGKIRTIKSKYIVGCDGAGSLVRKTIGGELKGDREGQAWGVMDVLPSTNFPDIRFKNIIKSATNGNILLIPREGGHLVRIYVELDKLKERGESKSITLDKLIEASKNIFKPYDFDVKEVAWWSVYEVGHSVTDKFDDVPKDKMDSKNPHVFIAGDACHTHSAKAGQGMNVSMGDTFNLGWKLISVLTGKCDESLLHSYSAERQAVAQGLIDYDHKWARVMSAPIDKTNAVSVQEHFVEGGNFTAGLSVKYLPSSLTGKDTYQALASGFEIGRRFHSAPVVRIGDAKTVHIGHTVKIDTKWRVFAFADASNPMEKDSRINKLCQFLQESPKSPILKHTKSGDDIDSVISLYGIFQQHHHNIEFEEIPSILKPLVGKYGLKDYEKMYSPDLKNSNDIFDMRGINRYQGCIVIVRPDQYVAHVLPLDAYEELEKFFAGIFLEKD